MIDPNQIILDHEEQKMFKNINEVRKMENNKPNYKGDGVAVWVNIAKNGKKYLSIKVVGHDTVYAFINDEEAPKLVIEEIEA